MVAELLASIDLRQREGRFGDNIICYTSNIFNTLGADEPGEDGDSTTPALLHHTEPSHQAAILNLK